ncbi:hypothetical protein [Pseudomonas sp. PDM13]|uniref:hypothetical protein n=1 Tax=Pseudomonas sp. PDM13 TaxID=2769255 RepID=UPI0021E04310|nr:hypothetical protein [Pseudomonas sp. PDM13]MCU9951686.1 hypothetical protein [Pseudomonas sp. PDM13]
MFRRVCSSFCFHPGSGAALVAWRGPRPWSFSAPSSEAFGHLALALLACGVGVVALVAALRPFLACADGGLCLPLFSAELGELVGVLVALELMAVAWLVNSLRGLVRG